jgi:hypothetical protein
MTKRSSTELVHLRANLRRFLNLQGTTFLRFPSLDLKAFSFLSFSTTFTSFRKLLHALLAENLQPRLSVEVFDFAHACSNSLSTIHSGLQP